MSHGDGRRAVDERCEACGFDDTEWNSEDTANTIRLAPALAALWSGPAENESQTTDYARRAGALIKEAASLSSVTRTSAGGIDARRHLHDFWHHLTAIAVLRSELAAPPAAHEGVVEQLSVSDGGVPKLAVSAAGVDRRGLVGDRQHARRHHGRPWQALCLWSAEVIESLAAEGHPIQAGAAGENLTLRGLRWDELHAGMTLVIGDVLCRLSAPAIPCVKNNQWFADGDSRRIDHDLHPGWSRWYASVLRGGQVRTGQPVTLIATAFGSP